MHWPIQLPSRPTLGPGWHGHNIAVDCVAFKECVAYESTEQENIGGENIEEQSTEQENIEEESTEEDNTEEENTGEGAIGCVPSLG